MSERKIIHDKPPYYAYFEQPDGSWYMLWMTSSQPKTQRGHNWHVHASFDKYKTSLPNLESGWYEKPYGMSNWNFDSFEKALEYFYEERFLLRLKHGYKLLVANIPEDWTPKAD
jgi:hypothetical protein